MSFVMQSYPIYGTSYSDGIFVYCHWLLYSVKVGIPTCIQLLIFCGDMSYCKTTSRK